MAKTTKASTQQAKASAQPAKLPSSVGIILHAEHAATEAMAVLEHAMTASGSAAHLDVVDARRHLDAVLVDLRMVINDAFDTNVPHSVAAGGQ